MVVSWTGSGKEGLQVEEQVACYDSSLPGEAHLGSSLGQHADYYPQMWLCKHTSTCLYSHTQQWIDGFSLGLVLGLALQGCIPLVVPWPWMLVCISYRLSSDWPVSIDGRLHEHFGHQRTSVNHCYPAFCASQGWHHLITRIFYSRCCLPFNPLWPWGWGLWHCWSIPICSCWLAQHTDCAACCLWTHGRF